jgi:hypothetical protein
MPEMSPNPSITSWRNHHDLWKMSTKVMGYLHRRISEPELAEAAPHLALLLVMHNTR